MEVAVFGAGAVGGYLAAKLALGGLDVALVAGDRPWSLSRMKSSVNSRIGPFFR